MENGNPALLTAEGRAALTLTPQHHHQQERNCLQMLVRKYKLKCQCCWYSVFRGPSAKFQKVEKKWRSVEREPEAQLSIQKSSLTAAIMQPSEEDLTSLWLPGDGRKLAHEGGVSEHVNSFPALERNKLVILYFTFANMSCPHQKYYLLISPKWKSTFVP